MIFLVLVVSAVLCATGNELTDKFVNEVANGLKVCKSKDECASKRCGKILLSEEISYGVKQIYDFLVGLIPAGGGLLSLIGNVGFDAFAELKFCGRKSPSLSGGECFIDGDCKKGLVCEAYKCKRKRSTHAICWYNHECASAECYYDHVANPLNGLSLFYGHCTARHKRTIATGEKCLLNNEYFNDYSPYHWVFGGCVRYGKCSRHSQCKEEVDYCEKGKGKCKRKKRVGVICFEDANCKSSYCKPRASKFPERRCARPGKNGDHCDLNRHCSKGYKCRLSIINLKNRCVKETRKEGCGVNSKMKEVCRSHRKFFCNMYVGGKACAYRFGKGRKCLADGECRLGLTCFRGKCQSKRHRGLSCERNHNCRSGLYCTKRKHCQKKYRIGRTCTKHSQCMSYASCFKRKCRILGRTGASCSSTRDCRRVKDKRGRTVNWGIGRGAARCQNIVYNSQGRYKGCNPACNKADQYTVCINHGQWARPITHCFKKMPINANCNWDNDCESNNCKHSHGRRTKCEKCVKSKCMYNGRINACTRDKARCKKLS